MGPESNPLLMNGVVRAGAGRPADAPPHRVVSAAGLSMICSDWTPTGADPDLAEEAAAVLHHNAVLSAYAAVGDVVPVRFGGAVSGLAAAARHLDTHAAIYQAVLARLTDAAEYVVRLRPNARAATPAVAPTTGRAYLSGQRSARDARLSAAKDRADAVAALFDALIEEAREASGALTGVRASEAAFLVPRGRVARLTEICATAHTKLSAHDLTLTLSGPWPAYSFAATEADETALLREVAG